MKRQNYWHCLFDLHKMTMNFEISNDQKIQTWRNWFGCTNNWKIQNFWLFLQHHLHFNTTRLNWAHSSMPIFTTHIKMNCSHQLSPLHRMVRTNCYCCLTKPPISKATIKGHTKQPPLNMLCTTKSTTQVLSLQVNNSYMVTKQKNRHKQFHLLLGTPHVGITKKQSTSFLARKFPHCSYEGNKNMFVIYDYNSNAIIICPNAKQRYIHHWQLISIHPQCGPQEGTKAPILCVGKCSIKLKTF